MKQDLRTSTPETQSIGLYMQITHFSITQHSPAVFLPNDGTIHVWTGYFDSFQADLDRFEAMLSLDERERTLQFRFTEHKNRYIIGRGLLRQLLSYYTHLAPQQIIFSYNPCGKPSVSQGPSFNVSYSDTHFVCAITGDQPIGVDLEKINPIEDLFDVARTCLSEWELQQFLGFPAIDQTRAFYIYWTCKEAVLKAIGCGLSIPLESIEIQMEIDLTPVLRSLTAVGEGSNNCWLRSYGIGSLHQLSVASILPDEFESHL